MNISFRRIWMRLLRKEVTQDTSQESFVKFLFFLTPTSKHCIELKNTPFLSSGSKEIRLQAVLGLN